MVIIRVRGGKAQRPRTAYLIPARARAVGGARDSDRHWLSKELLFFILYSSFKLLVFVVLWSREVRISGHGAHGSMQDDELYILALRSWV